jgi:hypothetical protein
LGWLIELNGLRASEEITEEQSRQVSPPPSSGCSGRMWMWMGMWMVTLIVKGRKAEQEIRCSANVQMLFDIEHAYNEFFRSLSSGSKSS